MPSARRSVSASAPDEEVAPVQSEDAAVPETTAASAAGASEDAAVPDTSDEATASEDGVAPDTSDEAAAPEEGPASDSPDRPRLRRPVALLGALAVAAASFGVWATVHGHGLRTAAAATNGALVDRAATRSVTTAVTHAVDTIFSYNYAHTASTRAAAQHLLTGQAIRQYNQLFALVEREAPQQKLVVTTKVTDVGIELLSGGRARVLVFANQQSSRAGSGQATYAGAMFAVTAVRAHGTWKLESIDTFTGSG